MGKRPTLKEVYGAYLDNEARASTHLENQLREWQRAMNVRKNVRDLMGRAADEIARLKADHIAAHRVSVMTIRHLEDEINRLTH